MALPSRNLCLPLRRTPAGRRVLGSVFGLLLAACTSTSRSIDLTSAQSITMDIANRVLSDLRQAGLLPAAR